MEFGLHIASFAYPGAAASLRTSLGRVVQGAEEAGFARITVMDHLWQVPDVGDLEDPMLEAYTTLGFIAAITDRVLLHTLVTAVTYREPALVAKLVTTLDVLSSGRAALGIGAGWNEEEAIGLGLPFPPRSERFERLEECIRIYLRLMESDSEAYLGYRYQLGRVHMSPMPIAKPRPPLMIGGTGERKTLRLVARYADSCNLLPGPELVRKLDVLRKHCEREGRDYDTIEKTVTTTYDPQLDRRVLLDQLDSLTKLGISATYFILPGSEPLPHVERIGMNVIGRLAD